MIEVTKADDFMLFCNMAKPGTACIYHLGELSRDSGSATRWELARLARAAYTYQQRGLVCLTQRRLGDHTYAYIATRTTRSADEAIYTRNSLNANGARR